MGRQAISRRPWSVGPAVAVPGAVDLFDDRGRHPTEMQLSAVRLDDFRSALPAG